MKKALLILILFPLTLMAQVERESPGPVDVSGRVTDKAANVLPGASVVFCNQMDTIKSVTDAEGAFVVRLRPGTYEFSVSYIGYQTFTSQVEARQTMSVNNICLEESVTDLNSELSEKRTFLQKKCRATRHFFEDIFQTAIGAAVAGRKLNGSHEGERRPEDIRENGGQGLYQPQGNQAIG